MCVWELHVSKIEDTQESSWEVEVKFEVNRYTVVKSQSCV